MLKVECLPHQERKNLWILSLDGEREILIHQSIFGKRPPLAKEYSSLSQFTQEFNALEYSQAKRYALKKLSLKNLHTNELTKSLHDKFVSKETISRIIEEFQKAGYLNDCEWLEGFIRHQTRRNKGPAFIEQKLRAKGIKNHELPIEFSDESFQRMQVLKYLKKSYSCVEVPDFIKKQKIMSRLIRRGFDVGVIKQALTDFYDRRM